MSIRNPFDYVRSALLGMELTHLWRGEATALFLEFGKLKPRRRRNGSLGNNPCGEISVGLEFDWRIEHGHSIVCGSGGNRRIWEACFKHLVGASATDLMLQGAVSEICLELSTGHRLLTCALDEDGPQWALTDRRGAENLWISFATGKIAAEALPSY